MREKERGRRKRTERAKKWREWALIIRLDSVITPHRSAMDWEVLDMVASATEKRKEGVRTEKGSFRKGSDMEDSKMDEDMRSTVQLLGTWQNVLD